MYVLTGLLLSSAKMAWGDLLLKRFPIGGETLYSQGYEKIGSR